MRNRALAASFEGIFLDFSHARVNLQTMDLLFGEHLFVIFIGFELRSRVLFFANLGLYMRSTVKARFRTPRGQKLHRPFVCALEVHHCSRCRQNRFMFQRRVCTKASWCILLFQLFLGGGLRELPEWLSNSHQKSANVACWESLLVHGKHLGSRRNGGEALASALGFRSS